ncbi:MAG: SdpI family protein [Pseudonocardia sp.]|nr:SdpI family protein [Pseudonocardia sp.]
MPQTLRLLLGVLFVLLGAALLAVAVLGGRSRLRRNRYAGVRTAATLASDRTFALANKVAAPLLGAAGAVLVVSGVVLLAAPTVALSWIVTVLGAVVAFFLAGTGGALGDRAAARAAVPADLACAGSCAGCSLVEGCKPAH